MMIFGILICVLLLILAIVVMIRSTQGQHQALSASRDAMNKAYYEHRLHEISEDQQQGVILESADLIRELQQNLLEDIPADSALPQSAKQDASTTQDNRATQDSSTKIVLILCSIVLIVVTVGSYWMTGGFRQVSHWQSVERSFPELNQKYNNHTLTESEISDYGLGLRSWLAMHPNNVDGWLTLGTLALNTGDINVAMHSFQQAFTLQPENAEVLASYGRVLLFSTNPQEAQLGIRLLNRAVEKGSVEAIKILAFSSLEAQDFPLALKYWSMWLQAVPADEPNRALIERTVNVIRQQLEEKK